MAVHPESTGLRRPEVSPADAERIARERYGLAAVATELGSNQDRNFVLTEEGGRRTVLRVDNPVFAQSARDAQFAALAAYEAAGVPVPAALPGLDGELTQLDGPYAVRLSAFVPGEPLVDAGYLAPVVLAEFGALAARSVNALAGLAHPGLDREHMWDLRRAHAETTALLGSISDPALRE
ncbi:phosphotransferase, partial [Leucobacter sp. M11]|uniref:phosphotransferase n=1 Tax=Leucobacter sp. M11 TaxID=2993565 RepID=UPI002D7F6F75